MKKSIVNRLIFIHVITTILLVTLIGLSLGIMQIRNDKEEVLRAGWLSASFLRSVGVDPVVRTLAYDRLEQIVQNLYKANPHISYIVLYNMTGSIVAFAGELKEKGLSCKEITAFYKHPDNIFPRSVKKREVEFVTRLTVDEDIIGLGRIGISNQFIFSKMINSFFLILGILLLSLGATTFVFYSLIEKMNLKNHTGH